MSAISQTDIDRLADNVAAVNKFVNDPADEPNSGHANGTLQTPDGDAIKNLKKLIADVSASTYVESANAVFDAVGDGQDDGSGTDNYDALQAALDSGKVYSLSPGIYNISQPLIIGDGTDSSIATMCGVGLVGSAGGVSDGEFSAPWRKTEIRYTGTTGGGSAVVRVRGPIHSVRLENISLNANDKADYGLDVIHSYASQYAHINVYRYRVKGFRVKTVDGPRPSGVTQGVMDNEFRELFANVPSLNTAIGLSLEGRQVDNVGCSRNRFIGGRFAIGGATESAAGIALDFCDNNIFIEVFTFFGTASTSGKGVYFVPGVDTFFPSENAFINCPIVGGVGGTPGTGGNTFLPYPPADGEGVPDGTNIVSLTHTGLLAGLQKIYLRDGTEAEPAYTFQSDQDTGPFRSGTNIYAISVGGTKRVEWDTSDQYLYLNSRQQANNPTQFVRNLAGTSTEQSWRWDYTGGNVQLGTWNDGGTVFGNNALVIRRSGTTVTAFEVGAPVTLPGDPTSALHAATKQYVDNLAAGLDVKPSVRFATAVALATNTRSGNILTASANGALTVDGGSPALNERILVKNEATTAKNGIYYLSQVGDGSNPWKLTRATDMDAWSEVPGANVWVEEGSTNADKAFVCTADTGGTLNTTAIAWSQFGGAGAYQAADATLTSLAALGTAADKFAYTTGIDTWAEAAITSFGRSLIDDADAAAALVTLGIDAAWAAYTPSVSATSGAITSASAAGRYQQIGKICFFHLSVTVTTNGTGSGTLRSALPVAAKSNAVFMARETAVNGKVVAAIASATSTTLDMKLYDNTYPGADGVVIKISGCYEVN